MLLAGEMSRRLGEAALNEKEGTVGEGCDTECRLLLLLFRLSAGETGRERGLHVTVSMQIQVESINSPNSIKRLAILILPLRDHVVLLVTASTLICVARITEPLHSLPLIRIDFGQRFCSRCALMSAELCCAPWSAPSEVVST